MATSGGSLNLPPGAGRAGEAAAESHLRQIGFEILARNYRTREGEVDIVARDGDTCVFVEVKARRQSAYGLPEESITATKAGHLIAAAQAYLGEHGGLHDDWRIDLVAVELDRAGRVERVELIRDAVTE